MVKVQFGDEVEDTVSGLIGIAMARIEYATGCNQISVTPKAKDNKLADVAWIDEPRLKVLTAGKVKFDVQEAAEAGGPSRTVPDGKARG